MTLKQSRIDVTDRVTGKLQNGVMELYLDETPIGKLKFPTGNLQYELDHHFEIAQQKIFQHVSIPDKAEPRYTDCDEGIWR